MQLRLTLMRLTQDGRGDLDCVKELGAFGGGDDTEEHAEGDAGDEVVEVVFPGKGRQGEPEGDAGAVLGEGVGTALQARVAVGEFPGFDTAGDGGIVVRGHAQAVEFVGDLLLDFLSNHALFSREVARVVLPDSSMSAEGELTCRKFAERCG